MSFKILDSDYGSNWNSAKRSDLSEYHLQLIDQLVEQLKPELKKECHAIITADSKKKYGVFDSWLGTVHLMLPSEKWPTHDGKDMIPLCQLNISQLSNKPEGLKDVKLITIFFSEEKNYCEKGDYENGDGWVIHTYSDLDELVPINAPTINEDLKILPLDLRKILTIPICRNANQQTMILCIVLIAYFAICTILNVRLHLILIVMEKRHHLSKIISTFIGSF